MYVNYWFRSVKKRRIASFRVKCIMMKTEHDLKTAEEAIKQAGKIKRWIRLPEEDKGEVVETVSFSEEELEAGFDSLHRLAGMKRGEITGRFRKRLEEYEQEKRHRRRLVFLSGAAAVAILFFGIYFLYMEKPLERESLPVVKLDKIVVPTLVQEEAEQVVSCEPLKLEKMKNIYTAGDRKKAAEPEAVVFEKVMIPAGYTYTVKLADGSKVVLNAGSELRFPSRFGNRLREVELKGEAFFEVVKSDVPFVVKAGDTRVKVYGTRFNFFYSEGLGISEAVLVEGAIGMCVGEQEMKITPNQRIFYTSGMPLQVEQVDAQRYTAWMGSTFRYEGMPLERIADGIARWYGVDIRLAPELRGQLYTIECSKSPTVERTMEVLGIIVGKDVCKEGGVYYIK